MPWLALSVCSIIIDPTTHLPGNSIAHRLGHGVLNLGWDHGKRRRKYITRDWQAEVAREFVRMHYD